MTSHSSRANCDKKESKYDKSNLNPPSKIPMMQPLMQWIKIFSEGTFLLFLDFKLEPFTVLFSIGIVLSVKKSKQISLLKQQCCKKIRQQMAQALKFFETYTI